MKSRRGVLFAVMLLLLAVTASAIAGLTGAIFTTNIGGGRVNQNLFGPNDEPCISGGPKSNSPPLQDGVYVEQVTNSSGAILLSTDKASCRTFRVQDHKIVESFACGYYDKHGNWIDCSHVTGIDKNGGITMGLKPFNLPPKNDVLKVWITPIEHYQGSLDVVDPGYVPGHNVHGFDPAWSKTDVFEVRQGKPFIPPTISVDKVDWDLGMPQVPGWPVSITDAGVTNDYYTPVTVAVGAGLVGVTEGMLEGWLQTKVYVDGVSIEPPTPSVLVNVLGTSAENHYVVFGNIRLGYLVVWKYYDANGNGIWDPGEVAVAGFKFRITGTDLFGNVIDTVVTTGSDGKAVYAGLPGSYTTTELEPLGNWAPTTDTSVAVTFDEGETVQIVFGNVCTGVVWVYTKGAWHQHLLDYISASLIDYINTLAPYSGPTEYSQTPFDGIWVPANPGNYFGEGAWAEISDFLVSPVSAAPPRFQLAQQLLAWICNVNVMLGGEDVAIWVDGEWVVAGDSIDQAKAVWLSGDSGLQGEWIERLTALNESIELTFICPTPCEVIYPTLLPLGRTGRLLYPIRPTATWMLRTSTGTRVRSPIRQ